MICQMKEVFFFTNIYFIKVIQSNASYPKRGCIKQVIFGLDSTFTSAFIGSDDKCATTDLEIDLPDLFWEWVSAFVKLNIDRRSISNKKRLMRFEIGSFGRCFGFNINS